MSSQRSLCSGTCVPENRRFSVRSGQHWRDANEMTSSSSSSSAYGSAEYWEARYQGEREKKGTEYSFEWYCSFSEIWPLLETHVDTVNEDMKVLHIGCGNSLMSAELAEKYFRNVLSIDRAGCVVNYMRARHSKVQGLTFAAMDVRKMDRIPDASYDIILEKACLDAVYCSLESYEDVKMALKEIWRVLKPKGTFLSVSHAGPVSRLPHLSTCDWDVDHTRFSAFHNNIGVGLHLYVCTKFPDDHPPPTALPVDVVPATEFTSLSTKDAKSAGKVRLAHVRDADKILRALQALEDKARHDVSLDDDSQNTVDTAHAANHLLLTAV